MTFHATIDKKVLLRLVVILVAALFLRLLMLGRESLWLDEIASWMFASKDLQHVLRSEPTNPPLYYLLLHFWMDWFGTSESAIRLNSAAHPASSPQRWNHRVYSPKTIAGNV